LDIQTPHQKGRALVGHTNTPPVVTITAFIADMTQDVPDGPFTATAFDAEQGDISDQIVWSTVADGILGTGASVTLAFSTLNGTTPLKASVVDAFDDGGSDEEVINVTA